jgi:hypothetical protein
MCSRKIRVAAAQGAAQEQQGGASAAQNGGAQAARLEVTCHPEATTFRDEGGRLNYLVLFVVLRVGHSTPAHVAQAVRMGSKAALEVTLEYEGGERVFSNDSGSVVEVLGRAGELSSKIQVQDAMFCFKEGRGSMRFRILKLSRTSDSRKFRVRVALKGYPEVGAAVSRATTVLSKRKWLVSASRAEEAKVRHQVEALAEQENVLLAELARGQAARANTAADLRFLCARPAIEASYPELQGMGGHVYGEHESDGSRTEAPGGAGDSLSSDQRGEESVDSDGDGLLDEPKSETELDETFEQINDDNDDVDDDDDLTEGGIESAAEAEKCGSKRGRPNDSNDALQAAIKRMYGELDTLHKRVELMEAADKNKMERIDTLERELLSQRRWNEPSLVIPALQQAPTMLSLSRGASLISNPGFAFGLGFGDGLTRTNSLTHSLAGESQSQ